jgi:hypothetical protein
MQIQSNKMARQLSSNPLTHRLGVLQSISTKTHQTTSKIAHLQVKAKRLAGLFDEAPEDSASRIDWVHRQLNEA